MAGPQPPILAPGFYELIYEFSDTVDTTNKFRNTFTIHGSGAPTATDSVNDLLGTLLQNMMPGTVQVDKVTAYNWARGAQPYPNGQPLYVKPYGVLGQSNLIWSPPLALPRHEAGQEVVMRMDHTPLVHGKPGRNFIRRFLGDDDIIGGHNGKWDLVISLATYESQLQGQISSLGVNQLFNGGSNLFHLVVVRYKSKPPQAFQGFSEITGLHFIGVTTNRTTRKSRR